MAKMNHWRDRRYWSMYHDDHVSRVSGFDERGHEHWCVIADGKGYSARRTAALEQIQESIEAGHAPGEVILDKELLDSRARELSK